MAADEDQAHKDKLRALLEEGGGDRVVAFIQGTADPELRRKLYSLARQALPDRKSAERCFDDVIRIARAGIAEGLRLAELARARSDTEEARECIDFANRLSYNLAADLAECWPGDEARRERRHFMAGLRAAYDCIVWRQELEKPPDRRAMAHWAAGMHQLSLGNLVEALCGFEAAFGLALDAAVAAEGGTDSKPEAYVKPNGSFGVILYYGYAGIARHLLGDGTGTRQFEQACAAFAETLRSPKDKETAEDAEFGMDQLRWVERKFIGAGAPVVAK
jgi:tetratricopeptide (TPR) repeat protein